MTQIYLVRHGETEMNSKGVYYGWTDCALSSLGLEQAGELAVKLAGIPFDAILSSSLLRARQTAGLISPDKPIQLEPRLREINFGAWEGKHYLEISEKYPAEWQRWTGDWQNAAPPGGETFRQFYSRVDDFLSELLAGYPDETVLLVAHHGSLRIILSRLLGLAEAGYWHFTFTQGMYSLVEVRDGHCVVKGINN